MHAPTQRDRPSRLAGIVLASYAIGGAGGFLFDLAGFPAAWVAGSTVAIVAASLAGVRVVMPTRIRDVVFLLLGISMGAGVSPETIERLPDWPVSLVSLAATVVAVTAGAFLFFRHVAGWNWRTALFASVPGALSYVLALAVETDADVRRIAVAQSIRILILVVVLPLAIASVGAAPAASMPAAQLPGAGEFAILLGAGAAAGVTAHLLRVPAGLMTGAFAASAVLHGAGVVSANLPPWLLIPCFLSIGILIGTRFEGADRVMLRESFLASLGGFAAGGAMAVAGVFAVVGFTDIGWSQAALAFAPGGLEAMTALSFALAADPAYVAAHQIFRFVSIALCMPAVLAGMERHFGRDRT